MGPDRDERTEHGARGRPTFGGVSISPILAAARALNFLNFALYTYAGGLWSKT